ncbi:Alpha/Beta hydrolase protein [Venturia nashicola]|uniref:Alpha/Beta hydrolase protein n=1 Tax=Venturia nashicola TaxID=86259 RepID=A0A4Z1P1Z7_9PEZI|nr:Alpha/Beta hydrolase protein [Venturia nashicola]TLD22469.1 Alpha/Beta hydrolase protein [Venturia nashicola]
MQFLKISVFSALLRSIALARPTGSDFSASGLSVNISVADGVLKGKTSGHVLLMFAPAETDPLAETEVSSPNYFFGQNVFDLKPGASVLLSGGSNDSTDFGLYGYRSVSLNGIAPGNYSVQAFLNVYEKAARADGSTVNVRFPCGDGAPGVGGYGTPVTSIVDVTLAGTAQKIDLVFNNVTATPVSNGEEIGGCQQGNYKDTDLLKRVKIRSTVLSNWWGRDVYVGADLLLPHGYQASDTTKRYPVIYSQYHWTGKIGAFGYGSSTPAAAAEFTKAWNNGMIPASEPGGARKTPDLILVTFRHENAFYDDSYAVNTANLGPWGDAINDELIPHLDKTFNTIAAPYARIQEGASTGGWESIASVIYRPDLFGACFSSYPDPLDFHRHQDIPLYTNKNAYLRDDGVTPIFSIRRFEKGVQINETSVGQENHWELAFGTSSRSIGGQWDIWNAVFGVQGLNHYPLEPWDKVTGEIYPEAVELWKPFDLANYITSNWNNRLNLGKVLKNRLHVYVGLHDDYFLNEGVAQFQMRVEEKGGKGWANFTYAEGKGHGGRYNLMGIWDLLEFYLKYVEDHAPGGKTPLSADVTTATARGNIFKDVMAHGGRAAALARQASPIVTGTSATTGKWDPGMKLKAQWIIRGENSGPAFVVKQGEKVSYTGGKHGSLQIAVTGTKRGYIEETRKSNIVS